VSILKTQAAALSRKSKGLLQAQVETSLTGTISHRLVLVVPALENYRYRLLRLHHSQAVYPVYIDESPVFVQGTTTWNPERRTETTVLEDEGSFRSWLRTVLAAPETKRILESLLAQAIA